MPKMKTKSGAKKRFKFTASGKIKTGQTGVLSFDAGEVVVFGTRLVSEAAAELVKCQMDDGYLGTYLTKDRWTEWDVWAHKYNLIGLVTYMRYTGNMAPLPTCRRSDWPRSRAT